MVGAEELELEKVTPAEDVHANVSGLLPTGLKLLDAFGDTDMVAGGGENSGLWIVKDDDPPTNTMVGGVVDGGTVGIFTFTVMLCVAV
jgi:hypothetical protein